MTRNVRSVWGSYDSHSDSVWFFFFFFQGNFFPLKTRFPFQRSRQGGRPCLHAHLVILFFRLASTIFLGMEVSQGMNVTGPELLGVRAASFLPAAVTLVTCESSNSAAVCTDRLCSLAGSSEHSHLSLLQMTGILVTEQHPVCLFALILSPWVLNIFYIVLLQPVCCKEHAGCGNRLSIFSGTDQQHKLICRAVALFPPSVHFLLVPWGGLLAAWLASCFSRV